VKKALAADKFTSVINGLLRLARGQGSLTEVESSAQLTYLY